MPTALCSPDGVPTPRHLTSPGVSISRNHGALRKTKINIKTILLNYRLYLDSTSFSINILFLFWTQFTIAPFSQCSCLLVSPNCDSFLGSPPFPLARPLLKTTGRVFCRTSLRLGVADTFSRMDRSHGFGGAAPEGRGVLPTASYQEVYEIDFTLSLEVLTLTPRVLHCKTFQCSF